MLTRIIWFIVDIPRDVFLSGTLIDFEAFFFKYVSLSLSVSLRKCITYKIKLPEMGAR